MTPWLTVLLGCAVVASTGAIQASSVRPTKAVPGAYIVEFTEDHDTDLFYHTLREKNVHFEHRREFNYTLFKGTSFRLHNLEAEADVTDAISAMSGIKKLWPLKIQHAPAVEIHWKGNSPSSAVADFMKRDYNAEKDTFSPHVMTQVDRLRADGVTGQGIRIGVIDTGIDYNHPALGGCFGEGCLVSYGYDYVGDDYDGMNRAIPDPDPDDNCGGHGTHVAGTIAAQANPLGFTGSAPDVQLGAYRVFGCPYGGSTSDDVFLAAMNQAYEDGSDIITMSLGSDSSWANDIGGVMASRLVEAGTIVVSANGNSGSQGLFLAGSPSTGKNVASIASVDNVEAPAVMVDGSYTIDNGAEEKFGWTFSDTYSNWGNLTLHLWSGSLNASVTGEACEPLDDSTPNLKDYIVLVRRGQCPIAQKMGNLVEAGARYVMLYNNVAGIDLVSGSPLEGLEGAGMTSADQGAKWIEALAHDKTVEVTIMDPLTQEQYLASVPNTITGGFASIFTSWGPNYEMDLKPSFAAPGGKILSTYPLALGGGYAVLSGTSMATPLVAGIYALLANVRGTKNPIELHNALSSTSKANVFHNGKQAFPYLAPAAQQGNGLVQAYDAAHATVLLDTSSLSFNDTANFIEKVDFSISNTGKEDVTFSIKHVGAATAYTLGEGSITPSIFTAVELITAGADLEFSETSIIVPAGGKQTISVTPKAPAGLDEARLPVYSGYIVLNGTNGENLSLPYVGLQGSLYDATILDAENTYLTRSDDMDAKPIADGESFKIPAPGSKPTEDTVYPVLAVTLALGTPAMRIDVVPQDTNTETADVLGVKTIGNLDLADYPQGYFARRPLVISIDGALEGGKTIPAGTYTLVVRALKIFGDAGKAEDWEKVETVAVTIEY